MRDQHALVAQYVADLDRFVAAARAGDAAAFYAARVRPLLATEFASLIPAHNLKAVTHIMRWFAVALAHIDGEAWCLEHMVNPVVEAHVLARAPGHMEFIKAQGPTLARALRMMLETPDDDLVSAFGSLAVA